MGNFKVRNRRDRMAIIAPGWSLTKEQCYLLPPDVGTIAIGNSFKVFPHADILYHADSKWWRSYNPTVPGHRVSAGVFVKDHWDTVEHLGVDFVKKSPKHEGFDMTPGQIVYGICSGDQALNLAVQHEPKVIYLLGFDLCVDPRPGPNEGKAHFDGDHPEGVYKRSPYQSFIDQWSLAIPHLDTLKIQVYNCNYNSAMNHFPKVSLEDVL